jgi:Zn-dependent protease with chaperone function
MSPYDTAEAHRVSVKRWSLVFAVSLGGFLVGINLAFLWLVDGTFWSGGNAFLMGMLLLIVGGCGLFQLQRLSEDGPTVARLLGGTLVVLEPQHDRLKQFRNVASEMAIASAIPMPALFVLESEERINAFAAGAAGAKTAICVSKGALARLTREELQGVVAHEMAHLRHDDVALSVRLSATIFGLLALAICGGVLLKVAAAMGSSRSKEGAGGGAVFLVAGMVMLILGGLGFLLAAVLDAKVSRQQEFRADAEAVRLMCTPAGIVGALVKLAREAGAVSGDSVSDRLGVLNPLHFRAAVKKYWFDTHPPLLERIRVLDPATAAELQLSKGRRHPVHPPVAYRDQSPEDSPWRNGK